MPIIFLRQCLKCPSFHKCVPGHTALPCKLPKTKPAQGLYYDLIRVPHGHIPTPMVNLWSHFPLPVKEFRDDDYYFCPECGGPSFFKIDTMCRSCKDIAYYDVGRAGWLHAVQKERWRLRRKYFRNFLKRIEYLILPFLVLIGKAWHVRSLRPHFKVYYEDW
jgi:hypothetical protein